MKLSIPLVAVLLLAVVPACKGKENDKAATKTKEGPSAPPEKPAPTCKPGELIQGDTCVAVVTADTVKAVQTQSDRIDQLAKTLDDVAVVSAPVELLKAFRELDVWQQMVSVVPELAEAEAVIDTLDAAVKQLAAIRGSLDEVRTRLGNVRAELQSVYATSGTKKKVDEVRATISAEIAAAAKTLDGAAKQVVDQVVTPTLQELSDVSDILDGACAIGKLQGGGADFNKLCGEAKGTFAAAKKYLGDLRTQPSALVKEMTTALETQLDLLLDQATKAALDEVQTRADALLQGP